MRKLPALLGVAALATPLAHAGDQFILSDPSGLSAEVEFTLLNPTTLEVRVKNTSTGAPLGFDSSDQLLTGVSWDTGDIGINLGDPEITGGTIVIGPTSSSLNFDTGSYGPGTNVGGEWGYGNMDGSGGLPNMISGNTAQVTPFGGPNLDGPDSIDGPQAGLVASPEVVGLGGLGAIQDEVIATLTISEPLSDLQFLYDNLVRVEFGSDAAFLQTPEPATIAMLGVGALALLRRISR